MRHAPTTDFYPLPAAMAVLPTPERMASVMRRIGEGTTREDFHRAPETCDLSDAQLDAHIGAAERVLLAETERRVDRLPVTHPWRADPDYRSARVEKAGALVCGVLADDAEIFAILRGAGYGATEIGDLWTDIVIAAIAAFQKLRPTAFARLIADLGAAADAFERQLAPAGADAVAGQLIQSLRTVIAGLRDGDELPPRHSLQTVRAFTEALAVSGVGATDPALVDAAQRAYATLRQIWGV